MSCFIKVTNRQDKTIILVNLDAVQHIRKSYIHNFTVLYMRDTTKLEVAEPFETVLYSVERATK